MQGYGFTRVLYGLCSTHKYVELKKGSWSFRSTRRTNDHPRTQHLAIRRISPAASYHGSFVLRYFPLRVRLSCKVELRGGPKIDEYETAPVRCILVDLWLASAHLNCENCWTMHILPLPRISMTLIFSYIIASVADQVGTWAGSMDPDLLSHLKTISNDLPF